jgi:uncharacterized membrane protein
MLWMINVGGKKNGKLLKTVLAWHVVLLFSVFVVLLLLVVINRPLDDRFSSRSTVKPKIFACNLFLHRFQDCKIKLS